LTLTIKDKSALYLAYMPFVRNGGLFMTPKGAQGKRTAGIGVQFSDQDRGNTQKKIENYLAGALGGDKPTHTM
jgi:type IV pilus assembly protein PilZ